METNKTSSSKEVHYIQKSLLPETLTEYSEAYQTVLDIAERLEKRDAFNIAVTGPYGSGKSTILKTLESKFTKYHYLHISLATLHPFNNQKHKATNQSPEEDYKQNLLNKPQLPTEEDCKQDLLKEQKAQNELIEYSILQQIIYKERPEALPYSRMKRIKGYSQKQFKEATCMLLLAVTALIILYEPVWLRVNWLYNLFNINWLNITADILSVAYLLRFTYKLTFFLLKQFGNLHIDKIALHKIEVNVKGEESIFNRHLDEILYFFEQTDYNVVLIEDLDRFENNEIYLKLRELNNILNESKSVGGKRKIYFIYAVRDDMFKDDERTKCFDYVTTVLPVINRSNSQLMLCKELNERGIVEITSDEIQDIAFFLDDMRLLRNIVNEYIQYKKKLGDDSKLKQAKLLAMIVYKNYSPKDFADLHKSKGKVYSCFALRNHFIKYQIALLDKEIKKIKEEHQRKLVNSVLNERELRTVYMSKMISNWADFAGSIKIDGNDKTVQEYINNDQLFNSLIKQSTIECSFYNRSYYNQIYFRSQSINFSLIEKEINPTITFAERLSVIRETNDVLEENIKKIEVKKQGLRLKTLAQVFNSIDRNSCKEYKNIKLEPRVEFFLLKGYITEDYYDYISYFYESDAGLNEHDWQFVRDVKLNIPREFDFHLDNAKACVKNLPAYHLAYKAILNIDILDQYASDSKHEADCEVILETAINEDSFDFLYMYYMIGKYPDKVFHLFFAHYRSSIWETFENSEKTTGGDVMLIWLKYAEEKYSCDASRIWIEKHYGFIASHSSEISIALIEKLIAKFRYKFTILDNQIPTLISTVVSTNSYMLNKENLTTIVDVILKRIDTDDHSLNLSTIYSTNNKILKENVLSALQSCLETIFTEPASKNEGEKNIIQILEADGVNDEIKNNYLQGQHRRISLTDVSNQDYKERAMKLLLVIPSWNEICHYFNITNNQLTDELSTFINKNYGELYNDEPPKGDITLFQALFVSNKLEYMAYKKMISKFDGYTLGDCDFSELGSNRMRDLIEHGMIPFSINNYKNIQSNFDSSLISLYLIQNKTETLVNLKNMTLDKKLLMALLESSALTLKDKSSVLSCLTINHLNESSSLADAALSVLINVEMELSHDIIMAILNNSTIVASKIKLLCQLINRDTSLDNKNIREMLATLKYPYSELAIPGKKPKLPLSSEELVKLLKKKGIVSSYDPRNNGLKIYTCLKV